MRARGVKSRSRLSSPRSEVPFGELRLDMTVAVQMAVGTSGRKPQVDDPGPRGGPSSQPRQQPAGGSEWPSVTTTESRGEPKPCGATARGASRGVPGHGRVARPRPSRPGHALTGFSGRAANASRRRNPARRRASCAAGASRVGRGAAGLVQPGYLLTCSTAAAGVRAGRSMGPLFQAEGVLMDSWARIFLRILSA